MKEIIEFKERKMKPHQAISSDKRHLKISLESLEKRVKKCQFNNGFEKRLVAINRAKKTIARIKRQLQD